MLNLKLVRDMIAKYQDFYKMIDFSKKYDQLFKINCKSSASVIVRLPTKTRKCFTQKKKEKVRLYYFINGNYCETVRTFDINESITVWGMINAGSLPNKMKLSSKWNFPGVDRPLTYPTKLNVELLKWIFVLRDLHFPVSVLRLQEKVKACDTTS